MRALALALALLAMPGAQAASAAPNRMAEFDRAMSDFISSNRIPGGSLVVIKDGSVVHARGYGWAESSRMSANADSIYRVASLSKPLTSLAAMSLVDQGRLQLDAKVTTLLGVADTTLVDPRAAAISVRHLLEHSGGWDRAVSPDPIGQSHLIAQLMGVPSPPDQATMTRYVLTRALDFTPGTRYAYSNVGYIVLAEVIAKVAGVPYQSYVRSVLDRAGAYTARVGATRASGRIAGEAVYYPVDTALRPSVYDSSLVSIAYGGGLVVEQMAGNGGWIVSARDLGRLVASLDRRELLSGAATAEMYARPAAPLWRDAVGAPLASYYAKGWMVRPAGSAMTTWHNGGMPGTSSMIVRRADGISWVALFNKDANLSSLDAALHRAADSTRRWP